jgi:hypothetical protein
MQSVYCGGEVDGLGPSFRLQRIVLTRRDPDIAPKYILQFEIHTVVKYSVLAGGAFFLSGKTGATICLFSRVFRRDMHSLRHQNTRQIQTNGGIPGARGVCLVPHPWPRMLFPPPQRNATTTKSVLLLERRHAFAKRELHVLNMLVVRTPTHSTTRGKITHTHTRKPGGRKSRHERWYAAQYIQVDDFLMSAEKCVYSTLYFRANLECATLERCA